MTKTKIDWADYVWNPVRGCKRNCPYCYAKRHNDRFWQEIARKENAWRRQHMSGLSGSLEVDRGAVKDFMPTWFWSAFKVKFPARPSRIFVNSMSDIHYWQTDWMQLVLKKIELHPQHTFLLLTKNINTLRLYDFPENCWVGVSVDTRESIGRYYDIYQQVIMVHNSEWLSSRFFICVEPIQEAIMSPFFNLAKWIIVGAETGLRQGKPVPTKTWIELIRQTCRERKIPLYMKDNLANVWGDVLVQQFPDFREGRGI